tara:strand:+ start:144 stop:878 length:735 start_codon:yes stop_codon:yes gene_type:complete
MKNLYFLILSLFVIGCSTSYVQKSPEWNPTTPQKTLLGHYKLKKVEKEVDLLDVVKVLATDENPFQNIGILTVPPLKAGLKKRNIDLYVDSSRAKKLNEMQLLDLEDSAGKKISNLAKLGAGEWIHPETGNIRFDAREIRLGEFYNEIVKTIDLKDNELVLSAEVSVKGEDVFLGLGKKVGMTLTSRILNSSGKTVYESNTFGESSTVWLSSDWLNEETVMEAMSNAVNEMISLEMDELSFLKM